MCIFSFTKTRNLIHYTYDTKLETQNVILYTLRSKNIRHSSYSNAIKKSLVKNIIQY